MNAQVSRHLKAQDQLEAAVRSSGALLEVFSELMLKGITDEGLTLSGSALDGLHDLAKEQAEKLRAAFQNLLAARRA